MCQFLKFCILGVLVIPLMAQAQVHLTSSIEGVEPEGTVHRVYVQLPAGAYVQSMYAAPGLPMMIAADGLHQSDGEALLQNAAGESATDSWFTIGIPALSTELSSAGGAGWSDAVYNFELGGTFASNDAAGGAFFLMPGSAQGDEVDGAVLVGQFVSSDTVDVVLNIQWKAEPGQPSQYAEGLSLQLIPVNEGCTDASASNFDPGANADDGSCTWESGGFEGILYEVEMPAGNGYATTYRIYAQIGNPNEAVVSWFGSPDHPLTVSTSTFFHQEEGGAPGHPGSSASSTLVERDSWVCIGDAPNAFFAGLSLDEFEAGGALQSDSVFGGAVAVIPTSGYGLPDTAGRVLLAQLTTSGEVEFSANVKVRSEDGTSTDFMDVQLVIPASGGAACTDAAACNFDPSAAEDDGSCLYEDVLGICGGDCPSDADEDGVCDDEEIEGCTDAGSMNFNPEATEDDGSCTVIDGEGESVSGFVGLVAEPVAVSGDSLMVHRVYAQFDTSGFEVIAMFGTAAHPLLFESESGFYQDPQAGPLATDLASAGASPTDSWLTLGGDAPGTVSLLEVGIDFSSFEAGGDLVVDSNDGGALFVIPGNEPAVYAGEDGRVLLAQLSSTGFIDVLMNLKLRTPSGDTPELIGLEVVIPSVVEGCLDPLACNFQSEANVDDGSCVFADAPCAICNPQGGIDILDADEDGVCDGDETSGCTDPEACNAGNYSDTDNATCTYPAGYPAHIYDCDGQCVNDADEDSVCDELEVPGCTDTASCNFDVEATEDDGSCTYPSETYLDCSGNCISDEDNDGVCDEAEYQGCVDPEACNYDPLVDLANAESDSCSYPLDLYGSDHVDCDGTCLNDSDGDGTCDEDELAGCTYPIACNFLPEATEEDGSCHFADPWKDCDGNCLFDFNGDGICDQPGMGGCTYPEAYNYDMNAAYDDGSCAFPEGHCIFDSNGDGGVNITDLLDMLVALGTTCP